VAIVTLDHLRLFRDLAHTRSVSRGAELNGVSQSAASQHVQELEKQLGAKLLDRSRRPLLLTPEGKLYFDFCRDVLRRYDEFVAALDGPNGHTESAVRVASIYSIGLSEMTALEEEFARRMPGAEIAVEYLRPEKVYDAVLKERAELGLVSYPEQSKEIRVIPWREETMVVALSPRHRLVGAAVLGAADLHGEDFVGFDEDLPISQNVRRFFREAAVKVNVVLRYDNIQSVKDAVEQDYGISILPEPILRDDVAQGRIRTVRLAPPGLSRPLGIIHLRKKTFPRAAQGFLAMLCEGVEAVAS
jgi:LysR family transcriptional regulator, transcriptional activator of the cysJI operon